MKTNINLDQAKLILVEEVKFVKSNKWLPKSNSKNLIENVILGSHLTYRYILITALLAKVTNNNINPLTLQAGSSLHGAYDARSLCHKVIVPLEREILEGKLGASNEPFLNKPARFKELSLTNAVRKGKDKETLQNLIEILNEIDKEAAIIALRDAIFYTLKRNNIDINEILNRKKGESEKIHLYNFMKNFISLSFEGETSALLAGTALYYFSKILYKTPVVKIHPVNQCGASSKEISDIDVYSEKTLIWTVEVKDKNFARQDVDHAIKKVIKANLFHLIFVIGPNAKLIDDSFENIENEWQKNGFTITFISIFDLIKFIKIINPNLSLEEFSGILWNFAKTARVKDGVFEHLEKCLTG